MNENGADIEPHYSDWELILRLLGLSWVYRKRTILVILSQVAVLALTLGGLSFMGLGVDVILHRGDISQLRLPVDIPLPALSFYQMLAAVSGAILALALLRGLMMYINAVITARLVQDILINLRSRVYDKLQRLSFRFFDANESGSIINRVTTDVQRVRMFVDGVIIQVVMLLLTLIVNVVYMTGIHAWLTLVCLGTTPLLWVMTVMYSRNVRPKMLIVRRKFDDLITLLSENIQGVHVVKGFNREQREIAKFRSRNREIQDFQRSIFTWTASFSASAAMLTQVNIVLLIGYGGYLVMAGRLELGSGLLVFYGLLQQFATQVATVATIANSAQMSLTGAERFFGILDAPIEINSNPAAKRLPKARGAVTFEKVSFGFSSDKMILQDINLHVEAGQCVAILGPTGAGKTTFLSLIPRFYDPLSGCIRIDGTDIRDIHLDDLRHQVGLVFQESFLFSNTVAANIAFGNPGATREQIEKAAHIAQAHEFIMQLDNGYDHIVGERGSDLSGGQRQRLSLARAVLTEPAILLLDDPTAAIDPQTEHEIQTSLENVMQNRTSFIVSHRISSFRHADLIIVLQRGRIVQTGSHDQLMNIVGHYRDIADIQFDQPADSERHE